MIQSLMKKSHYLLKGIPTYRKVQYVLLILLTVIIFYTSTKSNSPDVFINDTINTFLDSNEINTLVILSSSLKPRYLFLLPFTVASWNKLNASAIVFLIGDQRDFESNKQAMTTIRLLEKMNAKIIYLQSKKLSPVSLSQIARIFPAALPISHLYNSEKTIFVTSDADLFVFHLNNHIPNLELNKTLHLYNSKCCHPVSVPPKRGKQKVRMFPIGTIGATIKTWRDIMGYDKLNYTAEDIENYVIKEFSPNFFHFNDSNNPRLVGSAIWYADQSLVSFKLDLWLKKPANNLSMSERPEAPRRIDRIKWPELSKFNDMKISDWDDCHQPTTAYETEEWRKFKPFLEFAFKNDQALLETFHIYRDDFVS